MLIPWRRAEPETIPTLAELDVESLADMNRNLTIVLALMDLADLAAVAFDQGDYQVTFKALQDYHALRQEHAIEPLRI